MGFKQDRGGVISRGWSIFRRTSRKEAQLSRGSPGGGGRRDTGSPWGGSFREKSPCRQRYKPTSPIRIPKSEKLRTPGFPRGVRGIDTWPSLKLRAAELGLDGQHVVSLGASVPGFCGLDRGRRRSPHREGRITDGIRTQLPFPARGPPSVRGLGSTQLRVRPCHSLPAAVVTGGTQSPSEGWPCVTARSPAREAVLRWTTLQPLRVWG